MYGTMKMIVERGLPSLKTFMEWWESGKMII